MTRNWRKRRPDERLIGPIAYSLGTSLLVNETSVEETVDRDAFWQECTPCLFDSALRIAEQWCRINGFAGVFAVHQSGAPEETWIAWLARPSRSPMILRRFKYDFDTLTGRRPGRQPSLVISRKDGRILRAPKVIGRRESRGSPIRREWRLRQREERMARRGRDKSHTEQIGQNRERIPFGFTSYLDIIANHHRAARRHSDRHPEELDPQSR